MKISFNVVDRTLIAAISGEIDHHSAAEIKSIIVEQYSTKGCKDIIFDFSKLYFMDSAGIGMLIGRYKQACINGGLVYAVGVNPTVERIFDLSGLNKIIKRSDSIEAALNSNLDTKEVI